MQEFDREYCHEVKSACLQAIANTRFASGLIRATSYLPPKSKWL
jgi:hypothetical protein